ncbi:SBBP repeat-containing protein, partial [bacterium]|nr:SBBP repeat-containing protein [bacterium]
MKTKITSVLMTMVLITLATTGGLAAAELITKLNAVPNAFNSETSTTTINYELNQASGGNYTVNVRNQDDVSVRIYENNPIDGLTGNLVWDGKDTSGAAVVDGAYTIGFSTSVNLSDDYQFGGMWCSPGSGTGQLFYPWGIAIDSKGNYYITDYANDRIQKFDTNWNFIKMWGTRGIGSGQFFHPTGIAVDKDDNIYVSEFDNNRIQKFDSEGNFINFWGIRGDLPGQFKNPMGIVVNKNNELLVADYGNARIQKFSSAGIFISSFGTPGTGGGQFQAPVGIAVDQDANIYVTDIINKRIHIFDSNGNYKSGWILDNTFPQGVAVDSNGNIFISGYYDANISKYDKSGNLLKRWGSSGTGEMQLMGPSGIAIDSSNNVFVVERLNHRVQKFILPVAEETRECSVIVDNIVPEIVISDIPEYTKNIVVPVITITDDNLSNHEITMNGNVFVSGTQVTDDGNYKINVSATDSASNVFEKSVEFSIDTLNPEIIVTGVESEGIYNTSMKALINIVDANLMTSEVILNDEVYVSGTEILEDGEYVLKVGAVDKVGNSSNLTLDFSIDKTAPVIVVTGIENEKEYNTLVTPIIEIQDNGLFSQEVTVNSEEYISGNAIDEEGEYILLVKANDTSGNISEMEISFVIDKTAPVITVAGVNNGAYYNGTVSPAVEVTGSESYTIMLNGAEFISGSSVNYSGEYKLLITAIDTAGNESELQVGFVIDNIDPIISASGVVDNGIYSSAVVPEINIVESHIDTKTVLLNNIPYISGTEINQDGNYKLNVVVTDKAQNISYFEIGFTIDTIVPQINISGALEGSIYNSSVSPIIEITDANPGTSEILLNGETFVSGSELSVEGSYKLNVSAVDTAGNKNTTTLSFQVDKTVPAINISGVSEGGVYIDPVTPIIDVTDANLETSEILLNGEAFISGTVIEKEGEYELTVSAEDGAGNKSDVALKFTFENPIQNSTISAAHQADPFFPGYEFSEIKNDILEIVFSISGEAGQVENLSIVILDDVGNVIRNLLDGVTRTNGNHTVFWDGKDAAGNLVSDGEYIYRINGNDIVAVVTATVQKLTAVKIQKELVNISRILVLSSSEYRDGCFMHSVLESNKIFHKVVYSCTDFVKNMRTGIYNLYIINSGETNLGGKDSMTMRKELLVRVQNGDGLIG